jgi:MSHA biogenesis protein MshI
MRWPWSARRSAQRLVLRRAGAQRAFVLTDGPPGQHGEGQPARLLRWGLLPEARPVPAGDAIALLDPADYQILKVDTPPVPPEELKPAARWQIKEMVDVDVAELTLDVMHVGGDVERPQRQLFVVAARNNAIKALTQGTAGVVEQVGIVDIWETALRNLLAAQARADDLAARACAAVLIDEGHCILVVCAGDELYYTRRLEGDAKLLARARGEDAEAAATELPLGFEYQPGGAFDSPGLQESPLVVELQRSIDVWERSWPELPLARLYVITAEHGPEVATLIQRELGQRTVALDPLAAFAPDAPPPEGDARAALAACLPLLGAALRTETRKL